MKVSIRKIKNQDQDLTEAQFNFASTCVLDYMRAGRRTYYSYEGVVYGEKVACDVYRTKTTISAIVWYQD